MSKGGRPNKYETHVKPRFDEIAEWVKIGATDYNTKGGTAEGWRRALAFGCTLA